MSTPSIDIWPIKAFFRIVCAPYIIYVICIIFIVIKHALISCLRDDGDPVALLSERAYWILKVNWWLHIGQVSHWIYSEVHSRRIWGPQGPDPPAFLYFAEAWVTAVNFVYISSTVMSTRVCSSSLKCSATEAHTILKKPLIGQNVNGRCAHWLTLYIQRSFLKFSYWDISWELKWSGPR